MVTLGTDTERKFAWCLRKVNNRPFIYIHKRKDGYSKFNENDDSSNKIKIINGIIMFIMFIFCTIEMLKTAIYNTNSVTEIINDYKSNKIKEIIIIEN